MLVTASRSAGARTASAAVGRGPALITARTFMPAEARISRAAASSASSGRCRLASVTSRMSARAWAQIRLISAISASARASSRPISRPIRSAFSAIADRPRPSRSWMSRATRSRSASTAILASSARSVSSWRAVPASQDSPYTVRPTPAAAAVSYSTMAHPCCGGWPAWGTVAYNADQPATTAAYPAHRHRPGTSSRNEPAANPARLPTWPRSRTKGM